MSNLGTRRTTIMNRRAGQTARLAYWGKRIGVSLCVLGVVAYGGFYLWTSGWIAQTERRIENKIYDVTADVGFAVKNLMVEGRTYTERDDLMRRIGIERDDPTFEADLGDIETRLEQISWVRDAVVERRLPDTVYVRLMERTPLALWQRKNELVAVDAEGNVLTSEDLGRFRNLLIIVGDDAPLHAADLAAMVAAEPDLKSRVESAKWVGDRRWDLYLKNGAIVRMPEDDIGQAVRRLAEAQKDGALMDRKVESIDLRDPVRIVVQTKPGAAQDYEASFSPDKEKGI
jgi:cell division protein FtsQ